MTLTRFWRDDDGAILSAELVMIMTLLVIGLVSGLNCLQTSIVTELGDTAAAIGSLNQSYYFSGSTSGRGGNCRKAATAGSYFHDAADVCEANGVICEHPGEGAWSVPCDLLEQKPLETAPRQTIPSESAPQPAVPMEHSPMETAPIPPAPQTETESAPGHPE